MKRLLSTIILLLIVCIAFQPSFAQVKMKAGVAKAKITNTEPLVMVNGRMSNGVKEDIYARALVLNDGQKRLIIITYDLNCLDVGTPLLRERLQKEMGIDPEYVILLATHNHSAPIQINRNNFEYGHWLADRMFDLVQEAIENEQEDVSLRLGSGMGYFVFSVGNAPVDYEIQLLAVMKGEQPIAMLFNHGTHPVQAGYDKVEAGHPGYAMDEIEATFPGVQAMYADASGGNQFVDRTPEYRAAMIKALAISVDSVENLMENKARKAGHQLAEAVKNIYQRNLSENVTGAISSSMDILSLPLADPISKEEALELSKKYPEDVGFVEYPHPHRSTNWVRMLLRYYEHDIPFPKRTTDMVCTYDTYLIHKEDKDFLDHYEYSLNKPFPCIYNEVIVAQIGPMPLVAMQGEICAPIGMRIKDRFRKEIPIMVFGYMGEHNLYIPTRELVRLNAYQAQTLQIQYASPVRWDPNVEDEMVEGVIKMVEKKTGE
ncbi:MAG: hypothetical protein AAF587_00685 [Bacteroidota bacterium]